MLYLDMAWSIILHDLFADEMAEFEEHVQDRILSKLILLREFGPQLSRPHVDTLYGSKHKNMKELRLSSQAQVWRLAFAFDPNRKAILLIGGNKKGKNERAFYASLIETADERYDMHLEKLTNNKDNQKL